MVFPSRNWTLCFPASIYSSWLPVGLGRPGHVCVAAAPWPRLGRRLSMSGGSHGAADDGGPASLPAGSLQLVMGT